MTEAGGVREARGAQAAAARDTDGRSTACTWPGPATAVRTGFSLVSGAAAADAACRVLPLMLRNGLTGMRCMACAVRHGIALADSSLEVQIECVQHWRCGGRPQSHRVARLARLQLFCSVQLPLQQGTFCSAAVTARHILLRPAGYPSFE